MNAASLRNLLFGDGLVRIPALPLICGTLLRRRRNDTAQILADRAELDGTIDADQIAAYRISYIVNRLVDGRQQRATKQPCDDKEDYLKLNSKKYRLITALNESEKVRSGRR